ncbi:MAG: hypothetical protein ACRDT4_01310 [Micromonosporaceae bacterium]
MHMRNRWTRRCAACGDFFPCHSRRQALLAVEHDPEPGAGLVVDGDHA